MKTLFGMLGMVALAVAIAVATKVAHPVDTRVRSIIAGGEKEISEVRAEPERARKTFAVIAKVTAYCPCKICCGKHANGRTSTGKSAWLPGAAADPRLLPYGTTLEIPGVGTRVVDDTGGGMRQDAICGLVHIDVRMASHSEARIFGVRWLRVTVNR